MTSTIRDQRRLEIVAAARRIVASEGLGALTFGALERALPFTRGVITHHFASKDDIVTAVLDSAVREIDEAVRDAVAEQGTAPMRVAAAVAGVTRAFLDRAEATRVLVSYWGALPADPVAAETNAALFATWRRRCARLVREGIADGAFRADADPDATAGLMVGTAIGIVAQATFAPGTVDADALLQAACRAIVESLAERLAP